MGGGGHLSVPGAPPDISLPNFVTPLDAAANGAGLGRTFWAGLGAGGLHTLAGADHLAGLTPLTVGRRPAASALMGGVWGAGHSTGQLILGLAMAALKERFHQVGRPVCLPVCLSVFFRGGLFCVFLEGGGGGGSERRGRRREGA